MARPKTRGSLGPYLGHVEIVPEWVREPHKFPHTLPAVKHLGQLRFHPKVTFFVGENGSGKSTVLEAVAGLAGLNPEGGSRNFNFSTRESHSRLDRCLRLSRYAAGRLLPAGRELLQRRLGDRAAGQGAGPRRQRVRGRKFGSGALVLRHDGHVPRGGARRREPRGRRRHDGRRRGPGRGAHYGESGIPVEWLQKLVMADDIRGLADGLRAHAG